MYLGLRSLLEFSFSNNSRMLRVYVVMGRPAMMAEIVAYFPPATVISVQAQLKNTLF